MKKWEAMSLLAMSRLAFKEIPDYSFGEAIMDAEEQLEKIEKILNKIKDPSEDYSKYQEQLSKLTLDYAAKNPDGSPKWIATDNFGHGYYDIAAEKAGEFNSKKTALDKKNKKFIDEQVVKNENYNRALKEEATFHVIELHEKQLPLEILLPDRRVVRKLLKINKK